MVCWLALADSHTWQIYCRKFCNRKSVPVIWIGLFWHQACGFLQAPIRSMEQLHTFLQQICRMWIHPLGYIHRGRIAANPQNKICMQKKIYADLSQSKIRNKSAPIGTDFILQTCCKKNTEDPTPVNVPFYSNASCRRRKMEGWEDWIVTYIRGDILIIWNDSTLFFS